MRMGIFTILFPNSGDDARPSTLVRGFMTAHFANNVPIRWIAARMFSTELA